MHPRYSHSGYTVNGYRTAVGCRTLLFFTGAGALQPPLAGYPRELRRTRRSLGEGGHPQRELTLCDREISECGLQISDRYSIILQSEI